MDNFILKGSICFCEGFGEIREIENGYVVCSEGKCEGAFDTLPEKYRGMPVTDFGRRLIIPGLADLHTHAPQYPFRGTGSDKELLSWLKDCAFPEEEKYASSAYAEAAYDIFVRDIRSSATTRACIFATIHTQSAMLLMEKLEGSGLLTYVGKVSMDRNSPDPLTEKNAETELESWLLLSVGKFKKTFPILTPRFIPSCTDKLMEKLAAAQIQYSLPLQSHLSENTDEISLVSRLCPDSEFYGDAYDKRSLFGKNNGQYFKTVMAHCVHSDSREMALMRENGVFAAHCPASNTNLCSGIAPVRRLLENGVKVGLGTDIAAGHSLSVLRAAADAVSVSKLCSRLIDSKSRPLTFSESFFLATKGGGEFFGNCGSFLKGMEFDAVVLDDSSSSPPDHLTPAKRLERYAFISSGEEKVFAKYVQGIRIF